MLKSYWWKTVLAASLAAAAWGGTFGTVVSIGGEASDLALDETRGVLYIANFTANRIDVMSLATNTDPDFDQRGCTAELDRFVARWPLSGGHQLRERGRSRLAHQCADGDRSDQSRERRPSRWAIRRSAWLSAPTASRW